MGQCSRLQYRRNGSLDSSVPHLEITLLLLCGAGGSAMPTAVVCRQSLLSSLPCATMSLWSRETVSYYLHCRRRQGSWGVERLVTCPRSPCKFIFWLTNAEREGGKKSQNSEEERKPATKLWGEKKICHKTLKEKNTAIKLREKQKPQNFSEKSDGCVCVGCMISNLGYSKCPARLWYSNTCQFSVPLSSVPRDNWIVYLVLSSLSHKNTGHVNIQRPKLLLHWFLSGNMMYLSFSCFVCAQLHECAVGVLEYSYHNFRCQ